MLEEDDDSGCTGVDDSGSGGESEERDSRGGKGEGEGASESDPLGSGLVVGDFEPVSVQEKNQS